MRLTSAALAVVAGATAGCPPVQIVGSAPSEEAPVACDGRGDRDRDGIADPDEGEGDFDGDGVVNALDLDSDGDRIDDAIEAGDADCATPPVDTDADGAADFLDLDSDADLIADRHEGLSDPDGDGLPAYRDLDSDDDALPDVLEAGDADLATPPPFCPSFIVGDSDGDGLADGEEIATSPCLADTDGDGAPDLHEVAWVREACAAPTWGECDCPARASCRPPGDYLVLPRAAPAGEATVALVAAVQRLDLLFLVDTSGGATAPVLEALEGAMGTASTLLDGLGRAVPDVRVGLAEHSDFPVSPYGDAGDLPFVLHVPMTDATGSGRAELAQGFAALEARPGGDAPGAHLEAIYRAVTGAGATYQTQGEGVRIVIPAYHDDCPAGAFGAPCFREDAVPLVVHVTAACGHGGSGGPPAESPACTRYETVAPEPTRWARAADALLEAGARYLGVNASSETCATDASARGTAPCRLLSSFAEATGTRPPGGSTAVVDVGRLAPDRIEDALLDGLMDAIEEAALDATLALDVRRTDRSGGSGGLQTFALTRCAAHDVDRCWISRIEPEERAVGYVDDVTWYNVLPGTRLLASVQAETDATKRRRSRTFTLRVRLVAHALGSATYDEALLLVAIPAVF